MTDLSPHSQSKQTHRLNLAGVTLVRLALVIWAWTLVAYFLSREGLLRLAPLCNEWPILARFLPSWLIGDAQQPGAYPVIVRSLFTEPYRIWWSNIPWAALGLSCLVVGGYTVLGWLVLDWFEDAMPTAPRLALAMTLGSGIIGVACELVALAGFLTRPATFVLWGLLMAVALVVRRWRRSQPDRFYPDEDPLFARQRRRANALRYFWKNTLAPANPIDASFLVATWSLIGIISLLVGLHAIGLPETYWDSLILYVGYARALFEQHSFPIKICGQVGIGLGANYPHLYPLLTAQTATLAGRWDPVYAQVLPPVAGVASVVLVYATVLEFTRDRLLAASSALVFRAVPYGIAYFQYASDYAIAMLFTAAFLYAAARYLVSGTTSALWLTWLLPAFAVHINYLMWILWPVALIATLLAHVRGGSCEQLTDTPLSSCRRLDSEDPLRHELTLAFSPHLLRYEEKAWAELHHCQRLAPGKLLVSPQFVAVIAIAMALASPWYIRNIVLTGNPVYAFFYQIFPSKNVNPAVMKSAEVEWRLNGDGLGRVGRTLWEKLANSWYYFVTGPHHWKLGPVFIAFVVPGVLLFLGQCAWRESKNWQRLRPSGTKSPIWDDWSKFSLLATTLFFLLWFYAYVVADMYLYQIIIILPLFAIFAARVLEYCPTIRLRRSLSVLCLIIGLAPGVLMGAMGFKLKTTGRIGSFVYSQLTLSALRNLFIDPDLFYRMEFNGDMTMLRHINALPRGTAVLTHENRHLLLEPHIQIVHLDDWPVQRAYTKPPEERVRILDALGIEYYLYVPNEDKHRANSWLGMDELIKLGYFREILRTDSSGKSWRDGLVYRCIPPDKNVLYRRTEKRPPTP